jgi:carbamoyltransferase
MKILGIGSPFGHDHSAALLVDGKIVAAAEEERFTRKKHAIGDLPLNSVKFCLDFAGLKPQDVDIIAYPWSLKILKEKRWEYFKRTIFNHPSRAYKKFFRTRKELNDQLRLLRNTLIECGFDFSKVKIEWVEHHLAHAASSYFLSGFKEAAIISMDGGGEITSTLLGCAKGNTITKLKEIVAPDSLGNFYSTLTDYLGFEREDGEYKVMGMAPYGNADKVNFNHIVCWDEKKQTYCCSDDYVWVRRSKRFRPEKVYSKKMVEEFGLERQGDDLSTPYIHIAAATQRKLEEITIRLVDAYLTDELKRHKNLCFSGGCALNVSLNKKLLEHPLINNLWVQPASHDAGTALGAALFVAAQHQDKILPMKDVYLGPEYSEAEVKQTLSKASFNFQHSRNIIEDTAELLIKGEIVGWFQGRMEWGPRALGNRSILGNPTIRGTADRINDIIKFREKWRPFCPSILNEFAYQLLGSYHPASFMTLAFKVRDEWKQGIPEVVHVDGTCRPQLVEESINPKFYGVIKYFYQKTGVPAIINTSLNRRGEPMVCSPTDALNMFKNSGLKYLAIGDFLVHK